MPYPEEYGDQASWWDPRSRQQQGAYQQGQFEQGQRQRGHHQQDQYQQRDQYQQGQYRQQGPYQQDPHRRDSYQQRDAYQRGPYQQAEHPRASFTRSGQRPGEAGRAGGAGAASEAGRTGGATGNERLTVMTGAVLLVLLAVEGFTILGIRNLLPAHFFVGMLLLGPVALKAGSVTYRFFRYYTGHADYRRKGPPAPLLRLLGPFVMLLTAGVFGSGVMLAVVGPSGRQPWLLIHKGTFVLWLGAMSIHVLAYVWRLPRLLSAEARGVTLPEDGAYGHQGEDAWYGSRAAGILGGRGVRLSLLIASLAAGLVIALLTVHLAGPWQLQYQLFYSGS